MKIRWATLLMVLILTSFGCTSQSLDDAAVTAKVKARLAADKNTSAIKISAETHGGVVTLTGVVPTEAEKLQAGQVAKSTEGVRRVVNNVTVDPQSVGATNVREKVAEATERAKEKVGEVAESAGEALSDTAIQAKIKAQLVTGGITRAHVDVTNGEVLLSGEVANAQQKTKAEEIAKGVKGVHGVRNHLTIKKP